MGSSVRSICSCLSRLDQCSGYRLLVELESACAFTDQLESPVLSTASNDGFGWLEKKMKANADWLFVYSVLKLQDCWSAGDPTDVGPTCF
ncbi:hypothetical protein BaRGS_00037992 [Batillaria attramentaria]|uniref:Uncharacterized protein n=1 Tax=Batillaria attramentaria TaxID=370345 RepID=A0ABD0J7A9_9CAEN